jgi:AcrR family transcriptional regulator
LAVSSVPIPEPAERTQRRRSADRVDQMIDIADRQINDQRAAALSMQAIGDEAGVSRALVYAYFPDQYRLIDAVLARHTGALAAAGLERAVAHGPLTDRVIAAARIYLHHAAAHGATLEYVLREPGVVRYLDGAAAAFRTRLLRQLAGALRRDLRLSAHEALVFAQLLEVIPSEAARLVRDGQMALEEAEEINERLIRSSLAALKPR